MSELKLPGVPERDGMPEMKLGSAFAWNRETED